MATGDIVTWPMIKQLAERIDALYLHKLSQRPNSPDCTNKDTYSSYKQGIPILTKDKTAPFQLELPLSLTAYQRFEFGYSVLTETQQSAFGAYRLGNLMPKLHSMYLTKAATATAADPGYLTVTDLAEQCNAMDPETGLPSAMTIINLMESRMHMLNQWWRPCDLKYKDTANVSELISNELFFVTGSGAQCPCPAMYRVLPAISWNRNSAANEEELTDTSIPVTVCSRNGNGNSNIFTETDRVCPEGPVVHNWDESNYANIGVTLNDLDPTVYKPLWRKLRAVDQATWVYDDDVAMYPQPPTGCCHQAVFPRIGYYGGVSETGLIPTIITTMYDQRLFHPNFKHAITPSFSYVVDPMSWDDYTDRKPTLPSHCAANQLHLYEAHSHYENWVMCKEGATATIRITRIAYLIEEQVHIVYAPTAVIVKLEGKVQPAIRKRWYDMMYYKLRHIAGAFPPSQHSNPNVTFTYKYDYPQGTTWDYTADTGLTVYDKTCARWAALGYSWSKHTGATLIPEAWFGEKYMEQFLCSKNHMNITVCPGSGEWNVFDGCFCSNQVTTPQGAAPSCFDLACTMPVVLPWDGGCSNDICEDVNITQGSRDRYKTHWATVDYLQKIITFIENHKLPEDLTNPLFKRVGLWKFCSTNYQLSQNRVLYGLMPGNSAGGVTGILRIPDHVEWHDASQQLRIYGVSQLFFYNGLLVNVTRDPNDDYSTWPLPGKSFLDACESLPMWDELLSIEPGFGAGGFLHLPQSIIMPDITSNCPDPLKYDSIATFNVADGKFLSASYSELEVPLLWTKGSYYAWDLDYSPEPTTLTGCIRIPCGVTATGQIIRYTVLELLDGYVINVYYQDIPATSYDIAHFPIWELCEVQPNGEIATQLHYMTMDHEDSCVECAPLDCRVIPVEDSIADTATSASVRALVKTSPQIYAYMLTLSTVVVHNTWLAGFAGTDQLEIEIVAPVDNLLMLANQYKLLGTDLNEMEQTFCVPAAETTYPYGTYPISGALNPGGTVIATAWVGPYTNEMVFVGQATYTHNNSAGNGSSYGDMRLAIPITKEIIEEAMQSTRTTYHQFRNNIVVRLQIFPAGITGLNPDQDTNNPWDNAWSKVLGQCFPLQDTIIEFKIQRKPK